MGGEYLIGIWHVEESENIVSGEYLSAFRRTNSDAEDLILVGHAHLMNPEFNPGRDIDKDRRSAAQQVAKSILGRHIHLSYTLPEILYEHDFDDKVAQGKIKRLSEEEVVFYDEALFAALGREILK